MGADATTCVRPRTTVKGISSMRRREPRPARSAALIAVPVMLLGVPACQAMDSASRARQQATEDVREKATKAQGGMADALRRTAPGDNAAVQAAAQQSVLYAAGAGGRILDTRADPSYGIRVDLAVAATGEAGGGLDYESSTVRLCARLQGRPGGQATVEMTDIECPASLPASETGLGTIDGTVKLSD